MQLPTKLLVTILIPIAFSASAQDMLKNNTLSFIENKGQVVNQHYNTRNDIDLKLSGQGLNVFIGNGQLHYQFLKQDLADTKNRQDMSKPFAITQDNKKAMSTYRMDVELIDCNKTAKLVLEDKQAYYERYYTAATGEKGATAYSYKKATYKDIYPGIDWVIYIKNNKAEYEFIVNEHADASKIQIQYNGATRLEINSNGSFTATTPMGSVTEAAPYSYTVNGKTVASSYVLNGNVLSFDVGQHDGILVIDPSLVWGTYYHGSSSGTSPQGISSFDGSAIYMCGSTAAGDIATTGTYQAVISGLDDGFITKFDSAGNRIWATYYGGSDMDAIRTIDCSSDGSIYVAGDSKSSNGVASSGSYQITYGGGDYDGFLARFDSTGALIWGTYYGGSGEDAAWALKADNAGHVYIFGSTNSTYGFATTNAHQAVYGGGDSDCFIAKFDSAGSRLWGSYYGGSGADRAFNMAVDIQDGYIYLGGNTGSPNDIATPGCHQPTPGSLLEDDAFLAKFDTGGALQWGTYYGGSNSEYGASISMDASGYIYISGTSGIAEGFASPDNIASMNGYQQTPLGDADLFMAKFNSGGQRIWGSYYGGPSYDYDWNKNSNCTDLWNNIYIAGSTASTSGIASGSGWQQVYGGNVFDAFVMKLDSNGSPIWGSYYGGALEDQVTNILFDGISNLYILATTSSFNNMATAGTFQDTNIYALSGCLARIEDCITPAQPSAILGDTIVCPGSSFTLSVPVVTGAISYTWSLPTGWSGSSTTNSITITAGSAGGTVSVIANSNCASSAAQTLSISLHPLPVASITQLGNVLDAGTFAGYQWYMNGNIIPGATQQTYTVTQPGDYSVMVTDTNGCTAMSSPLTLSTSNLTTMNGISIYPNPTDGQVFISGLKGDATVTVMNVTGQTVYTKTVNKKGGIVIDLSKEPSGIYMVEVNENDITARSKVLKK